MNFEDDMDLFSSRRSATKHGRRASGPQSPNSSNEMQTATKTSSPPDAPIKVKKTGGWADEGSRSAKVKGPNIIEQERFQSQKVKEHHDDIPEIPDIDDITDDPLNLPDVKVPNVSVKESTYKELDDQFESGPVNFGNLGDIDLSFLTGKLYPEKEVQRCTDVWTLESLYQDLAKQ